jgi:hypothetical protein
LREQRRGGAPRFEVTMRDRESLGSPDPVLSTLDQSDFDEMWLFAVDAGNGLTAADRTSSRGAQECPGSRRRLTVLADPPS